MYYGFIMLLWYFYYTMITSIILRFVGTYQKIIWHIFEYCCLGRIYIRLSLPLLWNTGMAKCDSNSSLVYNIGDCFGTRVHAPRTNLHYFLSRCTVWQLTSLGKCIRLFLDFLSHWSLYGFKFFPIFTINYLDQKQKHLQKKAMVGYWQTQASSVASIWQNGLGMCH